MQNIIYFDQTTHTLKESELSAAVEFYLDFKPTATIIADLLWSWKVFLRESCLKY